MKLVVKFYFLNLFNKAYKILNIILSIVKFIAIVLVPNNNLHGRLSCKPDQYMDFSSSKSG